MIAILKERGRPAHHHLIALVSCILLLASPHTPAELDTNANNLSDLWEQQFNSGNLFPNTFNPAADPDKDGWTNAQEAAAGTDPFDPNPPNGFLRPDIIHIPAVFDEPDANGDPVLLTPSAIRVSWTTLPGKKYTLLYSPDLQATSWLPVEDSFIGNGTITEYNFPLATPTKTFWRVQIEDTDSDGDGLTDAEENQLGTNPLLLDSDGDDVPDNLDLNPLSGVPAFADADGDGISDSEDTSPYISRGAPPVISRVTQVGGRVFNLISDEKVQFVISVQNPSGPPVSESDLYLFSGQNAGRNIQGAIITPLGGDRFSVTWRAETHPNYPTALLQSLVIRYKDSDKATAWLDLGSCDVAEWEGLIAGVSDKGLLDQYLENPWLAKIASHLDGKRLSPVELAGSERISGGLRYRGPLTLKLLNTAGTAQIGEATIPTGYRYPMIVLSRNPTSGNVTTNRVLDISSPEVVPARGIGHLNNSSYEVMITIPNGSMITAPNELKFQGLPDREDDPNIFGQLAKVTSETGYFYDHSVSGPVFSQSSRNLHLGCLTNSTAPDTYAPVLSSFGMILDLESSIKSYAAGPPANPGLPEPRLSLDAPEPILMGSEEWRKVTIKVGPDTQAVSSGIGLWLREGENGDADPQSGFTITRKATDGTYVPLVIPEDGKINILPDDEAGLYAQLTSPQGLNLFIKRASSVGKVHALSIELLKKHSWNPNESFRISTLTLIPMQIRGYATTEADDDIAKPFPTLNEKKRVKIPNLLEKSGYTTEEKSKLKIVQWGDNDMFAGDYDVTFVDANFKNDVDVFRIRLPDFPLPPGSGAHRVKIWTTDKVGNIVDPGAMVDLAAFDNSLDSSSPFKCLETPALALVPNDEEDDNYPVEAHQDDKDGRDGKAASPLETYQDGKLGDRTYRAVLGGKVKIQWLTAPGSGAKPIIEIPVPAERIVKAKGFILPGTTDEDHAKSWFYRAKVIYTAIGVDLDYTLKSIPLPPDVNLVSGFDIPLDITGNKHQMQPETEALMNQGVRDQVPEGTIPVFFVNKLNTPPNTNAVGVTNTPSHMAEGDELYAGAIFIDSGHEKESVLAHELSHALLDAQHQPSTEALWSQYFSGQKCYLWWGDINGKDLPDVVVKGEWEETGIGAHRRFTDSMRSRIWKSPYAKLPTP